MCIVPTHVFECLKKKTCVVLLDDHICANLITRTHRKPKPKRKVNREREIDGIRYSLAPLQFVQLVRMCAVLVSCVV